MRNKKAKQNMKFHDRFSKPKFVVFGLLMGVVIATVGSVAALNGWFGGGNSIPEDTMARGLVGYWGFEEGSGTVAHDASNYGNNGILNYMTTGTDAWTKGKVDGALSFDGVDDYVNAGTGASFNLTSNLTLEVWAKTTGTGIQRIVYKGDTGALRGYGLWFFTGGIIRLGKATGYRQTTASFNDGNWHHIVGIISDSTTYQIYVDGVQPTSSTGGALTASDITSEPLTIGIKFVDGAVDGYYFGGLIDEVRIYNRALSSAEVRYHYNRGGPVAHWKFDEGNGTTIYDSTDNNNDGTMYYMSTSTNGGWEQGKEGSALRFDGVDDYISAGTNSALNLTSALTISAWVKRGTITDPNGRIVDRSSNGSIGYQMLVSTGGAISTYLKGLGTPSRVTTQTIDNNWHYVTLTYDSAANKRIIYIDGVPSISFNETGSITGGSSTIYIGDAGVAITPRHFNGLMDDLRIYGYARTADEIRLDYNAGFAAKFGYTNAGCQADPASCMTQGLMGYWGFEEGSGTVAHDASNYGNNGILNYMTTGTDAWTKGKVDGALSFDGVDDYVDAGEGGGIFDFGTGDFAVEAWIKRGRTSSGNETIISKWASGYPASYWIRLANNYLFLGHRTEEEGRWYVNSSITFTANAWYHIVVQRNSAVSNYQMFVNGINVTVNNTQQISYDGDISNNANLYFGSQSDGTEPFQGLIDEVRIYNRALSDAEVRYHYNKGGPVAEWKMDEGNGITAYDSTDNNNDGTMYWMSTSTSGGWTSGKKGSALSFDGEDDYIDLGNNTSIEPGVGSFTIGLWMKSSQVADQGYSLFWKGQAGSKGIRLFWATGGSAGKLTATILDVDSDSVNTMTDSVLNDAAWHYVVVMVDRESSVLQIYVDGSADGTPASLSTIGDITNATYGWHLGKQMTASLLYYQGLIDEVRMYNYARTPEEIRLDYNAGFAAYFGQSDANCKDNPASCMTQGLAGYWPMEEGSGKIVHDASDYANNGVFVNDTVWVTGKKGGALGFDGAGDYINIGTDNSLNLTGAQTIEAWIYLRSDPTAGNYRGIYNKPSQLWPRIDPGQIMRCYFYQGAAWKSVRLNSTISLNTWYHLVVTYDNTSARAYLNGAEDTGTNSVIAGGVDSSASAAAISTNSATNAWDGYIDEVRVYNRALSPEEIRYHYNKGGPVAEWKMDEGEGRTVYDSTDNNNDGTLVLAGSATSSAWVQGKYGSALSFDGVDDYVKSNSNFTGASSFSHSFWFKSYDGSYSADEYLLSQGTNDPSIFIESADNKVYVMADNANKLSSNATVNDTKWHFAQITADGSIIRFYLDGIYQSQTSYTGSSATGIFYIASSATPGNYFGGLIDDVRIYNYARTPEQIRQDYNAGVAAHFK